MVITTTARQRNQLLNSFLLIFLSGKETLKRKKEYIPSRAYFPPIKVSDSINFEEVIRIIIIKIKMEGSSSGWNSREMEVLSSVFGWIAFCSWSISFYPQVFLNFKRKSVVGLNFDFVVLNLTKHTSYLIYNASVYFSSSVQRQYHEKYGFNEMIPVAANDVAFSIHAVVLTAITLFQIFIYERGSQKVSKTSISIVSVAWLTVIVCMFIAIPNHSWLWLVTCFSTLQVVMTVIKYIPQAVMNFQRKSTIGFSIGNILLDLLGGLANYGQMAVQSIDQHSWVNFYGNIGKTLLSLVSVFFDLLFILQHYVCYPTTKTVKSLSPDLASQEPLVTSSEDV